MRINKQDRITIAKLKVAASLSEETMAFTADIYFDGKKVGYAKNDGQGGMTFCSPYEGTGQKLAEAEAFAGTLPILKSDGTQDTDHTGKLAFASLDDVVDELAYQEDLVKRVTAALKRKLKGKTAFKHDGKEWAIKLPFDARVKAHIEATYPGAVILNERPFDELLAEELALIEEESRKESARWEAQTDAMLAARAHDAAVDARQAKVTKGLADGE